MKLIGTLATVILLQLSFTGTAFSGNEGGNGPNDGIKELKQEFAATAEVVQQTIYENPALSHLLVSAEINPHHFWTAEQSKNAQQLIASDTEDHPASDSILLNYNEWAEQSVMNKNAEVYVLEHLATYYGLNQDQVAELAAAYLNIQI